MGVRVGVDLEEESGFARSAGQDGRSQWLGFLRGPGAGKM